MIRQTTLAKNNASGWNFKGEHVYRQALLVALLELSTVAFVDAQRQPSSSPERTQCTFPDHTNATVEYGTMSRNGRRIFGGLVPYGKAWETGYKRTSTFVTSANLVMGGKEVPAGSYDLSTIPDPDRWTMVLQKRTNKDSHDPVDEPARIDLTVRHLPVRLERLAISFDQVGGGCVLNVRWEQTEASVLLAEKK